MEIDYYRIGQQIRKYRKAYNLSQEQLAERIGISTTHMSHIETATSKLSLPVLVNIARELAVPTDELIFDKPQINRTAMTDEIVGILNSCSPHDMYVLTDVIKSVKISLDKHRDK